MTSTPTGPQHTPKCNRPTMRFIKLDNAKVLDFTRSVPWWNGPGSPDQVTNVALGTLRHLSREQQPNSFKPTWGTMNKLCREILSRRGPASNYSDLLKRQPTSNIRQCRRHSHLGYQNRQTSGKGQMPWSAYSVLQLSPSIVRFF